MEKCVQCRSESERHPIAIVMNITTVMEISNPTVLEISDNATWVTLPVCHRCHKAPKLKGHYFHRQDAKIGLEMAGRSELGL